METIRVGLIGSGNRALSLGTAMITSFRAVGMCVTDVYDLHPEMAQAYCGYMRRAYSKAGIEETLRIRSSMKDLLANSSIDLIMITTPQYFHRQPLEEALQAGFKVYCDKPLAHNLEDAEAMLQAYRRRGRGKVILGLTRRYENSWRRAYQFLERGDIGELRMMLLRSVLPKHTYFQRWHGRREISGGVINEKASHHFDTLNWFSGSNPALLSAFGGRATLLPEPNAPLRCSDCSRYSCPYRNRTYDTPPEEADNAAAEFVAIRLKSRDRLLIDDYCVFSENNEVMDHASVNMEYRNGVTAQLFLTVAGFPAEDQETLELVGTTGTIKLVRHTGDLEVLGEYGREISRVAAALPEHGRGGHFGADGTLIESVGRFARGIEEPTVSVPEGYWATRMAMATIDSIQEHRVVHFRPES